MTVENGFIPPEFGKQKTVMLVLKAGKGNYDKFLVRDFEGYKGEIKMIKESEKDSELYKDKVKYRYIFYFTLEDRMVNDKPMSLKKFYIYDRLENKNYVNKYTSSDFSMMRKVYVENLNKEIEKNK